MLVKSLRLVSRIAKGISSASFRSMSPCVPHWKVSFQFSLSSFPHDGILKPLNSDPVTEAQQVLRQINFYDQESKRNCLQWILYTISMGELPLQMFTDKRFIRAAQEIPQLYVEAMLFHNRCLLEKYEILLQQLASSLQVSQSKNGISKQIRHNADEVDIFMGKVPQEKIRFLKITQSKQETDLQYLHQQYCVHQQEQKVRGLRHVIQTYDKSIEQAIELLENNENELQYLLEQINEEQERYEQIRQEYGFIRQPLIEQSSNSVWKQYMALHNLMLMTQNRRQYKTTVATLFQHIKDLLQYYSTYPYLQLNSLYYSKFLKLKIQLSYYLKFCKHLEQQGTEEKLIQIKRSTCIQAQYMIGKLSSMLKEMISRDGPHLQYQIVTLAFLLVQLRGHIIKCDETPFIQWQMSLNKQKERILQIISDHYSRDMVDRELSQHIKKVQSDHWMVFSKKGK